MGKDEGREIIFEQDGPLAILRLNRPAAYNAMTISMADDLLEYAVRCDDDANVRAVLITGEGSAFCAGGDVRAMDDNKNENGQIGSFLKKLTVPLHAAVATFAHSAKPVMTAVNGVAAGGGFSLAICADLVLAARSAKFTLAYTRIGLAADGSSTFFLPRIVGPKRAFDLIARNRVLSAEEAETMGLVSEVIDDDGFAAGALAIAHEIANGPTMALGAAKRLIALSASTPLETQMEFERRAISACGDSADSLAGRKAFFGKTSPEFTGR